MSVESILQAVQDAGMPESVLKGRLTVQDHGGTYHTRAVRCGKRTTWVHNPTTVQVSLDTILQASDVCMDCVEEEIVGRRYFALHGMDAEVVAVHAAWSTIEKTREAQRVNLRLAKGQKVATGRVGKLRRGLVEVVRSREDLSNMGGKAELLGPLDDLISAYQEALGETLKSVRGKDNKDKVLARVQKSLAPTNWGGVCEDLDTTQVLIAIAPGTIRSTNTEMEEILTTFTIYHMKDKRFLVAPRYVYDHIQRSFSGGSWRRSYMTSIPMPPTHLLESVVTLWSPHTKGALSSLKAAALTDERLAS